MTVTECATLVRSTVWMLSILTAISTAETGQSYCRMSAYDNAEISTTFTEITHISSSVECAMICSMKTCLSFSYHSGTLMCKVHDLHFLASKANLNPTNITGWNYFTYAFRRTAKFLERSYMLVNFKSTWTKAKEYCLAMAYHLLEIASVEENTFIDGLAQNNQVWIGLYGETMSPDAYVWNFSMRRPQDYNYMNWANSEPSTFSNENCVVFEFDGSWNNINCKFEKAFVCEK